MSPPRHRPPRPSRRRLIVVAALLVLAAAAIMLLARPKAPAHETLPSLTPDARAFAATLEAHLDAPVEAGNRVDLLLNGDEIFPAIVAAIRGAREHINYAVYFWGAGPPGAEIAQALAERCRAGVTANVLLDGFGTAGMPDEHLQTITEAGCRVETFRPLARWSVRRHNNRNHRRILVVDGRVGITGGSGVSEKWMGDGRHGDRWRDTDVRIEGPAVRWLQAAFVQNWREATQEVLGGDTQFPPVQARSETRVQVVRSSPAGGSYAAYTMVLLAIASARQSLYLTNPYFVPDERMTEQLLEAAARGVRVVALTPGKIDHNLVRTASRAGYGRMLLAGVEIHEYQAALLHAKTLVVDGAWATIGSTNLDNRSFALNDELNVAVYDAAVARRLAQVFEEDLRHARRVDYQAWKDRPLTAKLMEWLVLPIRDHL